MMVEEKQKWFQGLINLDSMSRHDMEELFYWLIKKEYEIEVAIDTSVKKENCNYAPIIYLLNKFKNREETPVFFKPELKKHAKHNVKMSYFEKWITKGDFEFFTLEDFFHAHPKQRDNDRLTSYISDLISRKIISEPTKDKFRVNR